MVHKDTENFLKLLNYIRKYPDSNEKCLAKLCHISERKVYRYLKTLFKFRVLEYSSEGGYKITEEWIDLFNQFNLNAFKALKKLFYLSLDHIDDTILNKLCGEILEIIDTYIEKLS